MNKLQPKNTGGAIAAKKSERYTEAIITPDEWRVIKRMRQLWKNGAELAIIENHNDKLRIRRVGGLEG